MRHSGLSIVSGPHLTILVYDIRILCCQHLMRCLLVCSSCAIIQGVGDTWTDPQIHSIKEGAFGKGNLGQQGIDRFFLSHQCNSLCAFLRLPLVGHGGAVPLEIRQAAPQVRGVCPCCLQNVYDDQERTKNSEGSYMHSACLHRLPAGYGQERATGRERKGADLQRSDGVVGRGRGGATRGEQQASLERQKAVVEAELASLKADQNRGRTSLWVEFVAILLGTYCRSLIEVSLE